MSDVKTIVYLMPGMAANPSIFDGLALPEDKFDVRRLHWVVPDKDMGLEAYAKMMCEKVEANSVLVGVSFGGLLVQEMAKHKSFRKIIVISAVKSKKELTKLILFDKYTKVHRLLPTGLVNNVELLAKYAFGETVSKRLELYEQYLSVRDKRYIDWAIDSIVNWQQLSPPENVVHIHGEKDAVFPMANIKDCIPVRNGTHTMIIHRVKWFNENLPKLISSFPKD